MNQIYLVPGFFGFSELGGFDYFHHVSDTLRAELSARGIVAEIIEVQTLPTGSIRRRAIRLLDEVLDHGGLAANAIHFIGHSTGGLDVRMLLTPGVDLRPGAADENRIAQKTRSAISISTPHYGTPLANFFTGLNGRNLLYVLTVLATSGPGRYGLYLSAKLLTTLARLDRWVGQEDNILDNFADKLLSRITPERGNEVWRFVREVSQDQGAMVQLTPESMDIFNAAVPNRRGVDYLSFVTGSPPPNWRSFAVKPDNVYQSVTHAAYAASYWIAEREHLHYQYPKPSTADLQALQAAFPFPVDGGTNDGVVPTLSQIWGRLGGAINADHLDVVGQFQHVYLGETYTTWLFSGSGFDQERFASVWSDIADAIAKSQSGRSANAKKRKTRKR